MYFGHAGVVLLVTAAATQQRSSGVFSPIGSAAFLRKSSDATYFEAGRGRHARNAPGKRSIARHPKDNIAFASSILLIIGEEKSCGTSESREFSHVP